jgi:hypothetical protein
MQPVRKAYPAAVTGAQQFRRVRNHHNNIHCAVHIQPADNRTENPSAPTTLRKRPQRWQRLSDGDPMELDSGYQAPTGCAKKPRHFPNQARRGQNLIENTRFVSVPVEVDNINTAPTKHGRKSRHFRNRPWRNQNRTENTGFVSHQVGIDNVNAVPARRGRKSRRFRNRPGHVQNHAEDTEDTRFVNDPMEIDEIDVKPADCLKFSQIFQNQAWCLQNHADCSLSMDGTGLSDGDPMELDDSGPAFMVVEPVYNWV